MTALTCDQHTLRLHFPGWEALMTRRKDLVIPRSAITAVATGRNWTSEVLGFRHGLTVSGRLKVGTFVHPDGTRRMVSLRRGLPFLRVRVDRASTGFDEILVSTPDAEALAGAISGVRA